MTLTSPRRSSFLAPFSTSCSRIFVAKSRAVSLTPFTLFRGLECSRKRDDPLKYGFAPTESKYFTTVGMPRAAAMMRGYSSAPVLDEEQLPTSPDAGDRVSYTAASEEERPVTVSALGTFGFAPCRPINSFVHCKMMDSWTCLARAISTKNVPPVRTRRLIATGSYSLNSFFSTEMDRRFLDEWVCSVNSSSALSLRDNSRLYEWMYRSLGVAGRPRWRTRRGGM